MYRPSEVIEVVAADFDDRLEFMRDENLTCMERLRRKHRPLDHTGFLEFLFAQFLDGKKILQRRRGKHGTVRRGEVHREGNGVGN